MRVTKDNLEELRGSMPRDWWWRVKHLLQEDEPYVEFELTYTYRQPDTYWLYFPVAGAGLKRQGGVEIRLYCSGLEELARLTESR